MQDRRNAITNLCGHHYDTRGIVREGVSPVDPRLNSGPPEELPAAARRAYTSIDIETTGLDYEFAQVIEFGAVVDDWVTPIEKLPRFHAYLIHARIQGEPFALSMHPEILKRIANRDKPECANFTFLEPEQLAGLFELWAGAWGAGSPLIPAGKNFQGFDRPFLKRVPRFGRVNMLHRCIDPSMLYWNPAKDEQPPSTKECYERAGIKEEVAHTAVEDAVGIIKLIRAAATVPLVDQNDPRPPAARELAEKLSEHFRKNRQFTGQK